MSRAAILEAMVDRDREPALFGGAPLFTDAVGTAQLAPLDVEAYRPRLASIRASGRYAGGAQCEELEATLAAWHGVTHVVAVANASYGLLFALADAVAGRTGDVVMPSFSFRGLPYLARMVGREPRFVDVEARNGTLAPDALAETLAEGGVAAVLAVHNADAPADAEALDRVCDAAGVPLVFDSVFGFWNRLRGRALGAFGMAEVFSLHATKLLNGFEGGYVCTSDAALVSRLRRMRAGGPARAAAPSPFAATLNEYHAAAALTALPRLEEVVQRNHARAAAYRAGFAGERRVRIVEPEPAVAPHRATVLLETLSGAPLDRDDLYDLLNAEGALARRYYGPALHQTWPWTEVPRGAALPVTEILATRLLQLPVGDRATPADCAAIARLVVALLDRGDALAERLAAWRKAR